MTNPFSHANDRARDAADEYAPEIAEVQAINDDGDMAAVRYVSSETDNPFAVRIPDNLSVATDDTVVVSITKSDQGYISNVVSRDIAATPAEKHILLDDTYATFHNSSRNLGYGNTDTPLSDVISSTATYEADLLTLDLRDAITEYENPVAISYYHSSFASMTFSVFDDVTGERLIDVTNNTPSTAPSLIDLSTTSGVLRFETLDAAESAIGISSFLQIVDMDGVTWDRPTIPDDVEDGGSGGVWESSLRDSTQVRFSPVDGVTSNSVEMYKYARDGSFQALGVLNDGYAYGADGTGLFAFDRDTKDTKFRTTGGESGIEWITSNGIYASSAAEQYSVYSLTDGSETANTTVDFSEEFAFDGDIAAVKHEYSGDWVVCVNNGVLSDDNAGVIRFTTGGTVQWTNESPGGEIEWACIGNGHILAIDTNSNAHLIDLSDGSLVNTAALTGQTDGGSASSDPIYTSGSFWIVSEDGADDGYYLHEINDSTGAIDQVSSKFTYGGGGPTNAAITAGPNEILYTNDASYIQSHAQSDLSSNWSVNRSVSYSNVLADNSRFYIAAGDNLLALDLADGSESTIVSGNNTSVIPLAAFDDRLYANYTSDNTIRKYGEQI